MTDPNMSPEGRITPERTWRVRRDPKALEEARRFAQLAVSFCDEKCREATILAVCELVENLLKYSPASVVTVGEIAILLVDSTVRLRVTNRVASVEDAHRAVDMLSKIASCPSKRDLYRGRLRELFANPGLPRAQLGLLRVAFEGGFNLRCSFKSPELEIVAVRECEEAR
jgi:hypothetical protein